MKNILVVMLLAGILILSVVVGGFAQEGSAEPDRSELHIATTTPMSGNFFSSIFGNNTSDMDVRMLLHGYDLVAWTADEGAFVLDDAVVSGMTVTANGDGSRTYAITLHKDLYYSDGTPITAWDYAFSTLLTMSPEAEALGGNVKRPDYLAGYEDYLSGAAAYLAGIRVNSDDQLAVTVSAEYLPYFYELGLLSTVPYPISVIAPGIRVADDGNGVYLTNEEGSEAVFSAEMLRGTLLDPAAGYVSHPAVTSGPYKLVSYENGKVALEVNEYFKGDPFGNVPAIPRLTYETINNDKIIAAFADGSVDLLNKVTAGGTIDAGLSAVLESGGKLTFSDYIRSGMAFISFAGERRAVDEAEVRRAIACLIDKDAFAMNTVGEYGLRVDGYYGMGQWMYRVLSGGIDHPAARKYGELSLSDIPVYEFDPEEAEELLEEAGWDLNAEGGEYSDGLRYKQTESGLIPLRLTLACPETTPALAALHQAADELAAGGFEVEICPIPFNDLLLQFYGMKEKAYDMYFLSSNFDLQFDPSVKFSMNDAGEYVWTETGIADEELYEIAAAMRNTDPKDLGGYVEKWLEFQERFEEVLPMIPLYSNMYYDFYPEALENYDIYSFPTCGQAVVAAKWAE